MDPDAVAPAGSAPVPNSIEAGDPTAVEAKGRGQLALMKLRRDKVTMAAMLMCLFLSLTALLSPLLARLGVIDPFKGNRDLVTGIGSMPTGPLGGISWSHWMGVEPGSGRDLFSRIIAGLTISLTVAVLASLVTVVVGTILGIVAGMGGGRTDWLIGRLMDVVLSFPQLLMLLALAPVLIGVMHDRFHLPAGTPAAIGFMVVVLGGFGWPAMARIVRGQVLSLREREYIEAARSLGSTRFRLYVREILPHLVPTILIYVTLILPQYVAAEATLGFLGVGIQAPTPSLGSILNDSVNYASVDPAYFIFPGAVLALLVLSFNLLGDGLRDVLDPKEGIKS